MAKKPRRRPEDTLPTQRPKKTGSRGIGPLDVEKDSNATAVKAPDPEQQLATLDKQAPAKGSLLAEQPASPTVVNDRMKVFYDKPHHSKYKDVILIALQMSVPLTEKHLKLLPRIVADGYADINKKGRSRITFKNLPNQAVNFYMDSDTKKPSLSIEAAKIVGANLAIIERKGEGSAREVIRFAFRLQSEHNESLETFSGLNLANDFWLEMEDTQAELWDTQE